MGEVGATLEKRDPVKEPQWIPWKDQDPERLAEMLADTLFRAEHAASLGAIFEMRELMTKNVRSWWTTEKGRARSRQGAKASERETRRERQAALGKLSHREKSLLGLKET